MAEEAQEGQEGQVGEGVVSYNNAGSAPDISLPDIPMPTAEPEQVKEIKDEIDVAFKFAFVGAGQGGSRIAETFHQLGYRKVAVLNTAEQDLNTVNLNNKLCIGEGGAGKDPKYAAKVFAERRDDVIDFMRYSFGEQLDRIMICAGAGGGTGGGTVVPLIHAAKELQETLGCPTKKVGVILALPKFSEGKKVNANSYDCLKQVFELVEEGLVSPLVVIDNERIGKVYPNLVVSNFWQTANMSMAGLFHLFNLTAARDSSYSSFDASDYKSILDSGMMIFGAAPVENWKDPVSISRAIRDNFKSGLLSGGIDLSTGTTAGAIIVGGKEQLDNIQQTALDQGFDQLCRMLKAGNVVHRGIYSGDKPNLTVYTAIGGLDSPNQKLEELKKLGDLS
jgi:cell division GTPase FtsZ